MQLLTSYTWSTQRSTELLPARGITRSRLDGARGKKQVWRHMFEPELIRKQMYCTEVLVTFLGLFGTPQSYGAFIVIWRPGNCGACPPSLRPWLLRAVTCLNKSWYTVLTRGIWEPWALGGAKFSICPNFCALWRNTNRRILQGSGSISETCPKISGSFSWIF